MTKKQAFEVPDINLQRQIFKIRNTGETNMFDYKTVIAIAEREGLDELAVYIPEHLEEYTNFIMYGGKASIGFDPIVGATELYEEYDCMLDLLAEDINRIEKVFKEARELGLDVNSLAGSLDPYISYLQNVRNLKDKKIKENKKD